MFRQSLRETPLTNEDANLLFDGVIDGDSILGDTTALGTLRAIYEDLMPRDESGNHTRHMSLKFRESNAKKSAWEDEYEDTLTGIVSGDIASGDDTDIVRIVNINSASSTIEYAFKKMEKEGTSVEELFPNLRRVQKVTTFFSGSFKALGYIDEEHRNVLFIVEQLYTQSMHFLQTAFLTTMPWYINPGVDKLGQEKADLMFSLAKKDKTSDDYIAAMNVLAAKYNFEEARIKRLLTGFEKVIIERDLDYVRRELSNITDKLNDYRRSVNNLLRDKHEKEITLLGLTEKANGEIEEELMGYFQRCKKIRLKTVSNIDGYIEFIAKDYLSYFDEDIVERVINNKRSFLYSYTDESKQEGMKMLFEALFIDCTLKIRMCAAYRIYLTSGVDALSNYTFGDFGNDAFANPHIDRYSCLGDHQNAINDKLRDSDYIGAIEQCIASCKSLNFGDQPVMEEFMRRLNGRRDSTNLKCIELPDGRVVTPLDAIEYLKTQSNEE